MTTQELCKHIAVRPNIPSDKKVIGNVCNEYKNLPVKDRVVMDCGGNIGAFAVYAALKGATKVITYEPEPDNFNQLVSNCRPFANIIPYNYALIRGTAYKIPFYLTSGNNHANYSTVRFKGREVIEVNAVNFHDQLQLYRPSSIKMDIEGQEFSLLLEKPLPEFVKDIVLEIHFSKSYFRNNYFMPLKYMFQDWTEILAPKNTGANWFTQAQYSRP